MMSLGLTRNILVIIDLKEKVETLFLLIVNLKSRLYLLKIRFQVK